MSVNAPTVIQISEEAIVSFGSGTGTGGQKARGTGNMGRRTASKQVHTTIRAQGRRIAAGKSGNTAEQRKLGKAIGAHGNMTNKQAAQFGHAIRVAGRNAAAKNRKTYTPFKK